MNFSCCFQPMCCWLAHVVLLVSTYGVDGKHQWFWALNATQYVVGMQATCCQERVVLPKVNKPYLTRRFAFQRQYNIINLKDALHRSVCYFSFIGQQ